MFQNISKKMAAVVLAIVMSVTTFSAVSQPVTVQAASGSVNINLAEKVTDAQVKKFHQALMKNQRIVISFQDGYFYNRGLYDQLCDKVAKKYSYGVRPTRTYDNGKLIISVSKAKKYSTKVKALQKSIKSAVSTGSNELAQDIHDSLMQRSGYTFYTKGKPDAICKDLCARVEALNRQGVVFKYKSKKITGSNCYKVSINDDLAGGYYWAVKFSEKQFKGFQEGTRGMLENDVAEEEEPEKYDYNYYFNCLQPADRIIMNAETCGDLSDIMKLYLITKAGVFDSFTSYGMTYTNRNVTPTARESIVIQNLYNNAARGQCGQYAKSEEILFTYWGIDTKVCRNTTHAWTEGVATNSNGKKVKFKFDYKLETIGPNGEFSEAGGYEDCLN